MKLSRQAIVSTIAGVAIGAGGATAYTRYDANVAQDVGVYTDSLMMESCRGGILTGASCKKPRQAPRETFIRRFAMAIDSILADSVLTPPPPPADTTPPTPVNEDILLTVAVTGDTLKTRPTEPFMIFITTKVDSGPVTIGDSLAWIVSDTSLAKTFWNKRDRRLEVYTEERHTRSGKLTLTGSYGQDLQLVEIHVAGVQEEPPTDTTVPDSTLPDTTVPPADTTSPPPTTFDSTSFILTKNIGPTLDAAQTAALGPPYSTMDPFFVKWDSTRWAMDWTRVTELQRWSAGNYYDRALILYEQCARTADPLLKALWCARGDSLAVNYRRYYLHSSNYQTTPHWSQLDGVAMHYWRTGDDSSRIAVGKAAWNLAPSLMWTRTGNYTDARQQARALIGVMLAWQMNAPNAPTGGWAQALDRGLANILSQQSADGAWRYPVNTCDLSLNYMGAMLADALIRVHHTYRADPGIPPAVQKTADFLWTQWRTGDAIPSFNYYEGPCVNQHGSAGPTATADLTGLFTTTFAWMAAQDTSYRAKADAVFSSTIQGAYPQGSKQFNQAFAFGWRALGYLR